MLFEHPDMTTSPETHSGKRWVDIVAFNAEKQERNVLARCTLHGDTVHCDGEDAVVERLRQGITQPDGKIVGPKDGESFLRALQNEFRSAYLFATEIQEEKATKGPPENQHNL